MTRGPRVFVSLLIAILFMGIAIHYLQIPLDTIIPPPLLYKNCVGQTTGTATAVVTKGYDEHMLQGDGDWYYIDYTYQAVHHTIGLHGRVVVTVDPKVYQGEVRVTPDVAPKVQAGQTFPVVFDPYNPAVSGVPGTLGVWSTNTGWWNPYLWWILGLVVATYIIQEIIRAATKTADG
jgi:hypothetical protein